VPGRGHLNADGSAPDHGKPLGYLAAVGGVAIGPWPGFGDARQVGQRGTAAGAHADRVPRREDHQLVVRRDNRDPPGAVEPPVAAHQLSAKVLHPVGLAGVVPAGHIAIATTEHGRRVERTSDCLPRTIDPAGVSNSNDWPQQRLTRNATPVGAFTPDQLPLHNGDAEPGGAGPVRDGLADRARAEDDDVVDVFFYLSTHYRAHARVLSSWMPVVLIN
jgi:hypothetical protein